MNPIADTNRAADQHVIIWDAKVTLKSQCTSPAAASASM